MSVSNICDQCGSSCWLLILVNDAQKKGFQGYCPDCVMDGSDLLDRVQELEGE